MPVEFGEWVSDLDYKKQPVTARFHPFAHTESMGMVQGAEGFVGLLALAARRAILGTWLLTRVLTRGIVRISRWQISRWARLISGLSNITEPRYSSWRVRS